MDAADAGKRYRDALAASRLQRNQIEEDLAFSDPANPQQWDETEKRQRETDPGGIRPCLVMDQTGQYTANVVGQLEQRPPSIHAIPVDSQADIKTAERLDGYFRHVEYSSRASLHYMRAFTSAARAGVGYMFVRPEFTDRKLNYQEPRIGSEGDPLRVVLDPWSVELDGSDATWGVHLTPLSRDEFKRRWPKPDPVSFGDEDRKLVNDERESIMIAEQWRTVDQQRQMVVIGLPNGEEVTITEDEYLKSYQGNPQMVVRMTYSDKYRCVKWGVFSGADALEPETEYPADSIGIVPVYGYVSFDQGRMKYCGIARRAREPQRAYNFHVSEIRALQNQAAKSPWLMPLSGLPDNKIKAMWDKASTESRAYLPYQDYDAENNRTIPPPSRMPYATNLSNHIQGADQALRDIQAAVGMYQANLGAPSNETSGIAIEQRKQQGEASTAHFQSHLAASVAHVGRLCMQMVPKLYDVRRYMRTIGFDETPGGVTVDPGMPQARRQTETGEEIINPNVGKYDVRVVVGASYSTQRQQAQAAFTEMIRANPQIMPAVGPLWAKTLDVPNADKLAQVLTAIAPPEVRAVLQPEKQAPTEQVMAENQQLKMALAEATQLAEEAQGEIAELHAKLEDKSEDIEVKKDGVLVQLFDAKTKRLQAMLAATPTAPAFGPEQASALVDQSVQAALSGMPEADDGEAEAMTQALAQLVERQQQQIAAVTQGQQQIAQTMGQLMKMVQADRERVPVYTKDGEIERVVERLVMPPPEGMQ